MSAADPVKKLSSLLKKLRNTYDSATAGPIALEPTDTFDPLIHELIFSVLLWEASSTQARSGIRRLREQLCDCNELRVCMPDDVIVILGEKYPLGYERALRLRSSLNDVFHRVHSLSLQHVPAMAKREAKAYLDSLEGLPIFASHRVALVHGLAHAIPVDERLRDLLADESVTEPETPVEQVASWLEKHIPAEECLATYAMLQAWSDDKGHPPKRERKPDELARFSVETPEPVKVKAGKGAKAKAGAAAGASASVSAAATSGGVSGSGGAGGKSDEGPRKSKKTRTKSGG